jgi:hypothetical protein
LPLVIHLMKIGRLLDEISLMHPGLVFLLPLIGHNDTVSVSRNARGIRSICRPHGLASHLDAACEQLKLN